MRKSGSRRLVAVLLAALLGCTSAPEAIPPGTALEPALGLVGRVVGRRAPEEPRGLVVVVKDRHSTQPGFQRVRPQLRQVQRDNRLVMAYLVAEGYRLLGCEHPLGPIERNEETETQYRIIGPRLDPERELDEYGVFQPIRYQLLFGSRLEVMGVEDPELFAADLADFDLFARARMSLRRHDVSAEDRREIALRMRALHRQLAENVDRRGAAAAANLAALMAERELDRAILLLGGAHVPAAAEALLAAGYEIVVFESSRYADEGREDEPFVEIEAGD